jgi:hypothetical protein
MLPELILTVWCTTLPGKVTIVPSLTGTEVLPCEKYASSFVFSIRNATISLSLTRLHFLSTPLGEVVVDMRDRALGKKGGLYLTK